MPQHITKVDSDAAYRAGFTIEGDEAYLVDLGWTTGCLGLLQGDGLPPEYALDTVDLQGFAYRRSWRTLREALADCKAMSKIARQVADFHGPTVAGEMTPRLFTVLGMETL